MFHQHLKPLCYMSVCEGSYFIIWVFVKLRLVTYDRPMM
jgi:hypothetical protein